MGGGLLGSGFSQVKPDKDKVLQSLDIEEIKGDDPKQTVFDLNDDPLVSSLKEVEIEKKEEIDECREDNEVGTLKVGDLNETDVNKGRGEDNEENKGNDSVNKNVKEECLEGKVQFSGRVLRSMSAVKNGPDNLDDKGESGDDNTRYSNSCEKKPVEVDKEGSDQPHVEAKEVKRKPGRRSEMKCSDEGENKALSVERGQSNFYAGGTVGNHVKRKRGRPPKFQVNDGFEKKPVELQEGENNYSYEVRKEFKHKPGSSLKVPGDGGFETKRKRGRPPKVQGDSGFKKSTAKLEAIESDRSDGSDTKKSKHKRGRPTKVKGNQEFDKNIDEVKAREIYHSDVKTREETNCKHEIPPRMPSNDEFEMKAVGLEMVEGAQFGGELRKEVSRKRGRPPKVQDSQKGVIRKRGRPPKVQGSGEGVIRKRGRPPKLLGNNKVLTGKLIRGGKKLGGLKRGRKKLKESLECNVPASISYSEKRLIGKEANVKGLVSASKDSFDDMKNNNSKASKMLRPKVVNVEGKEKRVKKARAEVEQKRSKAKQAVRDRIVKLLKAAGWTIDYRPRNNREYLDAVYVNPEGKTHWSVTLAYRQLKEYYESGDSDSKVGPNGFIFTPIPEEELSILKRIVRKKRVGKKKPKGEDDDTMDDGEVEKKINKRIEKWKGNEDVKRKKKQKLLKEKILLHDEKNPDGTLQRGPGRRRKLQQTQNKGYALLVRNSIDGAESDSNGYVLYEGKRTVLAWLIDLGIVPQDGKVEYMIQRRTRTRENKSGRITRDGIQCNCCSDVFTVAEFETHAGSKLHRPFQNICLETGIPLLQCLLDAWNKQEQSKCKGFHYVDVGGEDPNDDTCGICGDGGDLICCDSCPSTFHQSCLDIKAFPSGNWNCVYCTCKYCGMVGNACQSDKDEDTDSTIFTCQLCEEKYHRPCMQQKDAFDDDSSSAFCGKRCKELFEGLQRLVGFKHELPEGFSWTLLRRFDISSDVCLNEVYQKVESNSKLAVALSVMHECFLPVVDHKSGINLIHNIVYNLGSNFTRLNYSGFFTAILERGDEIICAASIRIHGNQLAEMPFIGTRYAYRRQGMCRRFLCGVESALSSLNVEKLVIPAISELTETWTSVFGFQPLQTSSKQKMRNMNMLVFPGVDMLQKPLLTHVMEDQMIGKGSKKSGEKCPAVFDLNVSAESPAPQTDDRIDEPVEPTSLLPDGTLKYTSDAMAETINLSESATVSCSCIPETEGRKLDCDSQLKISSEEKIDESLIRQNFDSKNESSVENSNGIVRAKTEVAVIAHMSKVADSDRTVLTEEVKNCHAIDKDVSEKTSLCALSSARDVTNGHYDASNASKSSPSRQGDSIGASVEVLAPADVNFHSSYEACNDTSRKENLQLCMRMSTEVVSAGSEVVLTNFHDHQRETSAATV